MSDLHPAARALIDAARRGEGSLPPAARARVHRSVLRRAVALGAAAASTASAASKAAALIAALTSPLAAPGVIAAVAGIAFLVLRAGVTPPNPEEPRGAGPPAPMHIVAPGGPRAVAPLVERTPAIPSSGSSAASQETPPSPPVVTAPVAVPASRAPVFSARSSPATVTRGHPETPAAAAAAEPAAEGIESPGVARTAEEPSRSPAGAATPSPGVATATAGVDLSADLDLLRQVHAALRGGHPEAALSLLDRAGRGLEGGPLAEEAQAARVSALCQLGRVADARAATDRFLIAWPGSPLATRLRGRCSAARAPARAGSD